MEFFASAKVSMTVDEIQEHITLAALSEYCESIDEVVSVEEGGRRGEIFCSAWGQFVVAQELIGQGVRYTLPNCINSLQWTITPNPHVEDEVMIHATINRTQADPLFVETLETFASDWSEGLERAFAGASKPR